MAAELPWRQPADLEALFVDWRARFGDRPVARLESGPGWLVLALAGREPEPAHLILLARSGAVVVYDHPAPPLDLLVACAGRHQHSPLIPHLRGSRFVDARVLPSDLAIALSFAPRGGGPPHLLVQQLFGNRGNLILLEASGRLLWSLYPAPHPALLLRPAARESSSSERPDDSVAARFRAAAVPRLLAHLDRDLAAGLARVLRRVEAVTRRRQEHLTRDLAAAERGDAHRRAAEALAIHLREIPRGAAAVTLPEPAGQGVLEIALDPALSAVANMEAYFRKARRAERGHAIIAQRLAATEEELASLTSAEGAWRLIPPPSAEDPDAADAIMNRINARLAWRQAHADLLGLGSGPAAEGRPLAAAPPEPGRPFRRYLIDGRWEVWIGRNNQENDELTHHAAASEDYWLHAQGVAGSHAILRTQGRPEAVPRPVLTKAACLAALHSKARHAALVPVLYTLRKHVRKPRKSPPGTAACTREKTVFAEPRVPEGVEPT